MQQYPGAMFGNMAGQNDPYGLLQMPPPQQPQMPPQTPQTPPQMPVQTPPQPDIVPSAHTPLNLANPAAAPAVAPSPQAAAPPAHKGGIFGRLAQMGQNFDIGTLGAAILASYGNPVGTLALQMKGNRRQAEYEAALKEAERKQALADALTRHAGEREFDVNHPLPSDTERVHAMRVRLDPNATFDETLQLLHPASSAPFVMPAQGGHFQGQPAPPAMPPSKPLPGGGTAYWVNNAWYDNPEGR